MRDDKIREQNKTIRALKSNVLQLRKQLRIAESELELIRQLWEQDVIDMARSLRRDKIVEKRSPICPQCGNPGLTESVIGIWKLSRCGHCDYFDRSNIKDADES